MKNKFNTLQRYIFENSVKEYNKEAVNGLFRAILEPVVSNQNFESCILIRLFDIEEIESLIKRLTFSGAQIYSYSDCFNKFNIPNSEKLNIWGKTEFIIVLGQRYSAALIWDYTTGSKENYTNIALYYNTRFIAEIAAAVLDNSVSDFKELLIKYPPDRRENIILNNSIRNILDILNDRNEELLFSLAEKQISQNSDDTLRVAATVAEKAKFIAHEIKNNLSIINLYARITEKRFEQTEAEADVRLSIDSALKNINNASQTISYLINDLRCLSSVYITEFNLKTFILNTAALCNEKIKNAGMSLQIGDLTDIEVSSDITKLQCAVTNIIFNAVEAGKKGGKIKISSFASDNVVKIIISNNGEPISEGNRIRIFEPDFTTKIKGNGLGLPICKAQLELINGDIVLVKSDDSETVFEVNLDISRPFAE